MTKSRRIRRFVADLHPGDEFTPSLLGRVMGITRVDVHYALRGSPLVEARQERREDAVGRRFVQTVYRRTA